MCGRRAIAITRRLALVGGASCAVGSARAELADTLYTATAIVTGYDMRSRPAGFARCLRDVLVRVTGDPSIAGASGLPEDAAPLVTRFSYFDPIAGRRPHDDQGSYDRSYDLTVSFNRAKVDALAQSLGRAIWTGRRPVIVPAIRMHGTARPWAIDLKVTADDPAAEPERTALRNVADKYGVELELPDPATFAAIVQTLTPPGRIDAMAIAGVLEWTPEAFGWTGTWRARWSGRDYAASARGVSFDVAFDAMVAGGLRVAAGTGPFAG